MCIYIYMYIYIYIYTIIWYNVQHYVWFISLYSIISYDITRSHITLYLPTDASMSSIIFRLRIWAASGTRRCRAAQRDAALLTAIILHCGIGVDFGKRRVETEHGFQIDNWNTWHMVWPTCISCGIATIASHRVPGARGRRGRDPEPREPHSQGGSRYYMISYYIIASYHKLYYTNYTIMFML